jgi:SAM-dependent methyltransferase
MAQYDFYSSKKTSSIWKMLAKKFYNHFEKDLRSVLERSEAPAVIEVGPGCGEIARICANNKWKYSGVESNARLHQALAANGFNVVLAEAPPLPANDASYSCAVALNVLEHAQSLGKASALLAEFYRVLRSHGALILIVPSYLDWGKSFYNLDYTHNFITTEIRLSQMLLDQGFGNIAISYHYACFFGWLGRLFRAISRAFFGFAGLILPPELSRSLRFQKMANTFAENIIIKAYKIPCKE